MKNFIQRIKEFLTKPTTQVKTESHQHKWVYQYSTGNPNDGKSQVSKCDCGQWGVRHYGQAEIILLK